MHGEGSGTAAAATNTQWQERTAADVTRASSSSRPRRLAAGPADRRFLAVCEGSWAAGRESPARVTPIKGSVSMTRIYTAVMAAFFVGCATHIRTAQPN